MFRNIANTFANCFKIPELKSRILFTLGVLAICRLMSFITIPGLNGAALAEYFNENSQGGGGLLGMYNTFAGGALRALRHWRAGHHALHQRDHHPAIDDGGHPAFEQAVARGRRAGQNHPDRPGDDGFPVSGPGIVFCDGLGKSRSNSFRVFKASLCSIRITSGGISSRRCSS